MSQTALPPLDKVDPDKAWQPWEPDPKQPWDLKWAGHLYRRAAFGANLAELREAVSKGPAATLERLLEGDAQKDKDFQRVMGEGGRDLVKVKGNNSFLLRSWWLSGMLNTPLPLREKLTLFWHNHFATSVAKVKYARLMYRQNQLLREHALGKFGPLLLAVSKDPAMLIWLDSNSNVKGKPNENYAREVMELFSLGVGNYTEKDIREAARAFTGWHSFNDEFDFEKRFHDDGDKTVLGETGNLNGDDVVRIILKQDACARFLVRKLYRYFVSETQEPPAAFLEPLAVQLRKGDYDVGAVVKTMLRSRHFFSDYAYRQKIKGPAEFAVGTVLAATIERPVPVNAQALVSKVDAMGQQLFAPPNVKGWPGGKAWLNTSTVLARHNFAQLVASGTLKPNPNEGRFADDDRAAQFIEEQERLEAEARATPDGRKKGEEPPADPKLDAALVVKAEKVTEPAGVAKLLVEWFLQGGASDGALAKVADFLAEGKPEGAALDRRIRAAVHAVLTMPEYQLA